MNAGSSGDTHGAPDGAMTVESETRTGARVDGLEAARLGWHVAVKVGDASGAHAAEFDGRGVTCSNQR